MLYDDVIVQVSDVTFNSKNVPTPYAFESVKLEIFVAVPPDTVIVSYLLYVNDDDEYMNTNSNSVLPLLFEMVFDGEADATSLRA